MLDCAVQNCLLRKEESGYTAVVADFGLAGEVPGEFSICKPVNCDSEFREEEEDGSGSGDSHREPVVRTSRRATLQDGKKEVQCEVVESPSPVRRQRSVSICTVATLLNAASGMSSF